MRRALLLAPLLAAGCLSAPERTYDEPALAPPAGFAAEAPDAAPLERWWAELGGEELAAAVDEAFRANRDLRAAAARLDEALAEARAAGAALQPSVGLAADAVRQRQNFVGLPVPGGGDVLSSTSTAYGVSLDVSWEPDLWGRLRALDSAAESEVGATAAELVGAHLSLAGQVSKAWLALAEARRQAALAGETAAAYRANAEVIRDRYELGRAEAFDLHLLENQLAAAEALLALRREQEARAARQLEVLLGRAPGGRVPGADALPPVPDPVPAGLPADLTWRRPDLAAAAARLAALDWRLAAARADLLPSLRLTGSAGRRTAELGDLLDSSFDVWSLAAGLVQPLFEGGRLRARVDAADARARAALEAYAQDLLVALGEVETALAAEEHLAAREAALAAAAASAESARAVAQDRYFEGLVDVVALLDAERRALSAESELLAVRRARLETRVDLFLALGGGFGDSPPPLLAPLAAHDVGAANPDATNRPGHDPETLSR